MEAAVALVNNTDLEAVSGKPVHAAVTAAVHRNMDHEEFHHVAAVAEVVEFLPPSAFWKLFFSEPPQRR